MEVDNDTFAKEYFYKGKHPKTQQEVRVDMIEMVTDIAVIKEKIETLCKAVEGMSIKVGNINNSTVNIATFEKLEKEVEKTKEQVTAMRLQLVKYSVIAGIGISLIVFVLTKALGSFL